MHHKKEWVQLPYEGALYQSLGANTKSAIPLLGYRGFFIVESAMQQKLHRALGV